MLTNVILTVPFGVRQNRARIALKEAEVAVIEARRHVTALENEAKMQAKAAEMAAKEANAKLHEVDSVSVLLLLPRRTLVLYVARVV